MKRKLLSLIVLCCLLVQFATPGFVYASEQRQENVAMIPTENSDVEEVAIAVPDENEFENSDSNVTTDVYRQQPLASQVEYILHKNESILLRNLKDTSGTVRMNGSKSSEIFFDYVKYNEDGTVDTYDINSTGTSLNIVKNRSVLLTGTSNNPVTIKFDPDRFALEYAPHPALDHIYLSKGDSYAFYNLESSKLKLLTTALSGSKSFDYAVYQSDGTLKSIGSETNGNFEIPEHVRAVITSVSETIIEAGIPYGKSYIERSNEPALTRVTLTSGESYYFENIAGSSVTVYVSGANSSNPYQYAKYKEDGSISALNEKASGVLSLSKGISSIVTIEDSSPITYIYAKEQVYAEETSEVALRKETIGKNQSYYFANMSDSTLTLYNDSNTKAKYDYVMYNQDGTIKSQANNFVAKPIIPPYGSIVVTVVTDIRVSFWSYNRYLIGYSSEEPALEKQLIRNGSSYSFKNPSTRSQSVIFDSHSSLQNYPNVAVYYENGKGKSKGY